jgi:hypothetical protein
LIVRPGSHDASPGTVPSLDLNCPAAAIHAIVFSIPPWPGRASASATIRKRAVKPIRAARSHRDVAIAGALCQASDGRQRSRGPGSQPIIAWRKSWEVDPSRVWFCCDALKWGRKGGPPGAEAALPSGVLRLPRKPSADRRPECRAGSAPPSPPGCRRERSPVLEASAPRRARPGCGTVARMLRGS